MRLIRFDLLWPPLVLAALLVIYIPGLGNQPVFDDESLVSGRLFAEYASLLELRPRMLSYGSFVWVREVFGEGWWKQRLFNVLIHCGVVVALWAFYREILRHVEAMQAEPGDDPPAPLHQSPALGLAIGFFALNPVAVYAVAYLIQRSILMAMFFVVVGLWLFARGLAERKPALHVAALACYVLAVMSKEYAVLTPLAAIPVYILVSRPDAKRLAVLAAAGAVLVGLAAFVLYKRYGEIIGKPFDENSFIYLAQLAQLQPGADTNAFALSVINQAYLFFHYGLRWFIPTSEWMSINLRPPFPVTLATFPHILGIAGYVATLAGGFYLLLRHRDWRALMGLCLLLPALLFATEFATVWVQDPFVLYRSYLWAIGVPGLVYIALHGTPTRILAGLALVLGGLLCWQAVDRVLSLSTPERAWSDAIAKLPNDPRSVGRWFTYLNRGAAHVDGGRYNLAMQDFEQSSKLGDMGTGLFNRAALYAANGEHANALATLDAAERQGYNLYNLPFQRGLSLEALGRLPEAHLHFTQAFRMNPRSPTRELVMLHLGRVGIRLGKVDEAVAVLQQLVLTDPAHADGRFYLATALVMQGQHQRALELLDALHRERPSARTHYTRALAYFGLKRKAEALADIEAAIRMGADNPSVREWRARIAAMP